MSKVKEAAEKLVAKLEECRLDPQYQSVWNLYYIHGNVYTGATYYKELDELQKALKEENEKIHYEKIIDELNLKEDKNA